MRPPVSATEPCRRGVLIRTRGGSAIACSRASAARFGRDGVVAAAAPRMAARQPAQGEAEAAPDAVPFDGFGGVMRAARIIPAGGRQDRRDDELVTADCRGYAPAQNAARAA